MAASHPRNVDARGSTFTYIGRDSHTHYQTVHVHLSHPDLPQRILRNFSGDGSLQTPTSAGFQSGHSSLQSCFAREVAAGLVIKIMQSLMEREPRYFRLKLVLELLHKTLTLGGLAIQAYEYTPLGRNLANVVNQEAEKCCIILQELLDKINCHCQGLISTNVQTLWRRVLWSGCGLDEMEIKLSSRQRSLGECLMALNSYVSLTLQCCYPLRYLEVFHGRSSAMDCVQVV